MRDSRARTVQAPIVPSANQMNEKPYPSTMRRILLTGLSGTGKSTLVRELAQRGYKAVDTDTAEWCEWVPAPVGEDTVRPGSDWIWREDRIQALLDAEDADLLFISGCKPNQVRFYPRFDHVVLLSTPLEVQLARLRTRSSNNYGKAPEDRARILRQRETIEPQLRQAATDEVDTSVSLETVIAAVLDLANH